MIDTEKIKQGLNVMTTAVNGMMTTEDDAEKNAWVTIYNARFQAILTELDKEKVENVPEELPDATTADEPTEVAPAPEKFVLDE